MKLGVELPATPRGRAINLACQVSVAFELEGADRSVQHTPGWNSLDSE